MYNTSQRFTGDNLDGFKTETVQLVVIGTHLQECTLAHIISRITSAVTRHCTRVTKITRHSCIRHHTVHPKGKKGKGRVVDIAPQADMATMKALRYMACTKQRRTYLPRPRVAKSNWPTVATRQPAASRLKPATSRPLVERANH